MPRIATGFSGILGRPGGRRLPSPRPQRAGPGAGGALGQGIVEGGRPSLLDPQTIEPGDALQTATMSASTGGQPNGPGLPSLDPQGVVGETFADRFRTADSSGRQQLVQALAGRDQTPSFNNLSPDLQRQIQGAINGAQPAPQPQPQPNPPQDWGPTGPPGTCFAGDTPVRMADGTTRALKDLQPGDETAGGTVQVTHRMRPNEDAFLLDGVVVAGDQGTYHNGRWVRARDVPHAEPTTTPETWMDITTDRHLIFTPERVFLDYEMVDQNIDESRALAAWNVAAALHGAPEPTHAP